MNRKEIYSVIKENKFEEAINKQFGKNFTNVSNDDLLMFLRRPKKVKESKKEEKKEKKKEKKKITNNTSSLNKQQTDFISCEFADNVKKELNDVLNSLKKTIIALLSYMESEKTISHKEVTNILNKMKG